MTDINNRRDIERLMDELEAAGISRRGLLRGAGAGALGMGLAGFLAACGGGGGSKKAASTVIPKGQVAGTLNFSNWPYYIDKNHGVFKDFQHKYGTKVKYTEEINDNNEFFGKVRQQLARGQSGGRDLFVVTDWMASRMIKLGYVQKLDHSALPNVTKNLVPALQHPSFDPNRDYSVPWQSGMTGLIYRADKIAAPQSINDIFDPKLKGKVTMLTEMRDTVGLTMLGMGKDPTTGSVDDALAALDKVDKANRDGQIRRFTGNDYIKDLPKGDSYLVYGWSGDATGLQSDNPNIKFFFPPEGFMLWSDNMQIPVGAPHAYTAELMMNWVYDPVEQAKIAEAINYLTPVNGVREVFTKKDPKLAQNQFIFPSEQLLKRGHIFRKLQPDEEQQLDTRFEQVLGA